MSTCKVGFVHINGPRSGTMGAVMKTPFDLLNVLVEWMQQPRQQNTFHADLEMMRIGVICVDDARYVTEFLELQYAENFDDFKKSDEFDVAEIDLIRSSLLYLEQHPGLEKGLIYFDGVMMTPTHAVALICKKLKDWDGKTLLFPISRATLELRKPCFMNLDASMQIYSENPKKFHGFRRMIEQKVE